MRRPSASSSSARATSAGRPWRRSCSGEFADAAGLGDRVVSTSAGTGDWHVGEPADQRTIDALERRGYDGTRHRARQFTHDDFAHNDLVVALDRSHERILRGWARSQADADKIALLMSFDASARARSTCPIRTMPGRECSTRCWYDRESRAGRSSGSSNPRSARRCRTPRPTLDRRSLRIAAPRHPTRSPVTSLPPQPLSPLDGRYRAAVAPLADFLSEAGLNRARVEVEVEWLIALTDRSLFGTSPLERGRQGTACARCTATSGRPRSTGSPRRRPSPVTT